MEFVSLIDEQARAQPGKACLKAATQEYNYAQFAEQTRRAATALRAQGLGKGDKLGLLCYNTPGFVIALFGAWRIGAVVVPINHKLQAPEVDYVLAHSGSKACVIDGALAPLAERVKAPVQWLSTDSSAAGMASFDDLAAQAAPSGDEPAPASDEIAEILYTSGTTGNPKGCLHTHANVFLAALCAATGTSMTRNDRTLIAMPVWHSSPLNNWLLGTLVVGGSVVLLREYAPKAFLDVLAAERISFTFGAPIAFLAPLSVVPNVQDYDLGAMRMWAYGGGPLGADMARKLAAAYRSDRFVQVYGMTESGPLGTVLFPEEAVDKAGSIGRAGVPGVSVQVRGADGQPCQPGEVGEIHLRSPAVMKGYVDDPQATAAAFDANGWYRTGDLARIDEDGYLFIVDRLKDMIITGGENVYSKEVEDVLSVHPAVQDVAVIGRPHPEWGETVTAVVVLRAGQRADDTALTQFLAPRLARYKIPRTYEFRDAIARTATGKLLKHQLRD